MSTLADKIRLERGLPQPKQKGSSGNQLSTRSSGDSNVSAGSVSISIEDDTASSSDSQIDSDDDDCYNPPGLPRRLRSTNVAPEKFNKILAERRVAAVKNMKAGSIRVAERENRRKLRAKVMERRKAADAERRAKERIRRQIARGQQLDPHHQSAIGYQMALKKNAMTDDLMVQDIIDALVRSRLVDGQYAESLLLKLQ